MKKTFTITLSILLLIAAGVGIYYLLKSNDMMSPKQEMEVEDNQISDRKKGNSIDNNEIDKKNTYIDVTPQEAKTLIDNTEDLVILDVSNRYEEGHIPNSINYYVGDGSLDQAIPNLNQDVPYLVYCHVDSASISGAQKLIEAGFAEVYRLEGNYSAWVDAGYKTEK